MRKMMKQFRCFQRFHHHKCDFHANSLKVYTIQYTNFFSEMLDQQNCIKPYSKQEPSSEVITAVKLQHATNRVWACVKLITLYFVIDSFFLRTFVKDVHPCWPKYWQTPCIRVSTFWWFFPPVRRDNLAKNKSNKVPKKYLRCGLMQLQT